MDVVSTANPTMESFLSTAKALPNDESAVSLIKQVIESPNIYSFSEILETPSITRVRSVHSWFKCSFVFYRILVHRMTD